MWNGVSKRVSSGHKWLGTTDFKGFYGMACTAFGTKADKNSRALTEISFIVHYDRLTHL
jgi:hypothetical protein